MRKFDDIIRQKLEQLPLEGTPDWSGLEQRIEGDAFDSLLRDQLTSTTSASGADKVAPAIVGWEALSSKLDLATEMEGEVFDRILSQKLAHVESDLAPQASWKVLSHRMDTLWPLRKVLARYRVLEMAAAIALLLTFAPLLKDNPITILGSGSVATTEVLQSLPQKSTLLESPESDQFLQPAEIAELVYADNNISRSIQSATGASTINAQASPKGNSLSATYSPFAMLKGVFQWVLGDKDPSIGLTGSTEQVEFFSDGSLTYSSLSTTSYSSVFTPSLQSIENLEFTSVDHKELTPLEVAKNAAPLIAPYFVSKDAKHWEIGAHAGVNAWNISTPVDYEFEQQALNRWNSGPTVGFSANRKLSERTALGLGASLSSLTYDPNLPTVSDAADFNSILSFDRTESFDAISLDIAQVPVDFRVQLTKPGKRLSVFAFGGVAANFTLTSTYDGKVVVGEDPIEIVSGPSELEEIVPVERVYSAAKDFSPGLLEQGGFAGNTFFSARAGLETTYKVNDQLSVFSSLNYNQHLPIASGIGPNNDRLSSAGLLLGARISL